MKHLVVILTLFASVILFNFTPNTTHNHALSQIPINTEIPCYDNWNNISLSAILNSGSEVPSVQTLTTNQHSSQTPIFRNHLLAKAEFTQLKRQHHFFSLLYIAATDAVTAHYYVFALRRILC